MTALSKASRNKLSLPRNTPNYVIMTDTKSLSARA